VPTRRRGQLSDAQTLAAYEAGASIVELAVAEGLTAYGVISRLGRARRRRYGARPRYLRPRRVRRPAIDTWEALHEAVAAIRSMSDALDANPPDGGRAASVPRGDWEYV
jgi:hypothetical protein